MKMYVGTAKSVPASLTPRRLTSARMITPIVAISACWPWSAGMAVVRYVAADDMDTATVST
ncbi:hypothetical protein D3C73_1626430 [compost metagenome]